MSGEIALPLFGHKAPQDKFLKAMDGGRLHHAWIVEGPSGIGKARFALRLAAMLLGAKPADEDDRAGAATSDPVMQKVLSSGHPDLKHVQRAVGDNGKLKQDIAVDQIRELNQFFSLKPALGGWRIGILDSLDEMNANGRNALLKTLEEPPPRAMLFLISHATVPVLATIRSRCQSLRLTSLSKEETLEALQAQEVEAPQQVADLVAGRPGRAEALTGPKVLAASHAARSFLKALPKPADAVLSTTIQAAAEDEAAFGVFAEELMSWVSEKAEASPAWADIWFQLHNIVASQRNLHMTPVQAASKLVSTLQTGTGKV
jgi:DNA polymerase III subunit delta'